MHLHPHTFAFLTAINEYNTRQFFATAKPLYEDIYQNMKDICAATITSIAAFDPAVEWLTPKDCMFRIYRDARRLKEWDQIYKNNFGFVIWPWWKKSDMPAYYFHLEPNGKSFFGGGVYMPQPQHLRNLRAYLEKHGDQYKKIIQKPWFKKTFGAIQWQSLSRPPMWFKHYTPYLEFIQRKQHLVFASLDEKELLESDIVALFTKYAKASYEWMHFLRTGSITPKTP